MKWLNCVISANNSSSPYSVSVPEFGPSNRVSCIPFRTRTGTLIESWENLAERCDYKHLWETNETAVTFNTYCARSAADGQMLTRGYTRGPLDCHPALVYLISHRALPRKNLFNECVTTVATANNLFLNIIYWFLLPSWFVIFGRTLLEIANFEA